ncbi:hypothetical protein BS78_04G175400 [Paspalum vaginatum]|nr:hypothetical protein BS78_04G175400 [Paspalum vaginatum]
MGPAHQPLMPNLLALAMATHQRRAAHDRCAPLAARRHTAAAAARRSRAAAPRRWVVAASSPSSARPPSLCRANHGAGGVHRSRARPRRSLGGSDGGSSTAALPRAGECAGAPRPLCLARASARDLCGGSASRGRASRSSTAALPQAGERAGAPRWLRLCHVACGRACGMLDLAVGGRTQASVRTLIGLRVECGGREGHEQRGREEGRHR